MVRTSLKQLLGAADTAAKSGDASRAITLYRQILTQVPKHTKAKRELGRLEKQTGASGAGRMTQTDAQGLIQLVGTGDFARAEQAAKALARRFPNEPFVFNILGFVQGNQKKTNEAIASFKWALSLNPNFIEALSNYGSFLVQAERNDEAIGVLQKAIAKKPDYAEAQHNLGIAYLASKDPVKALSHYNKAIEIKPDYANALNSRGTLRMNNWDHAAALEDFERAQKLSPNDMLISKNRVAVLASLNRDEDALVLAKSMLDTEPDDTKLLIQYGTSLSQLGRSEEAKSIFKRVLELDVNNAPVYRLLGDLLKGDELKDVMASAGKLFHAGESSDEDIVHLGFALGQGFERLGDFQKSCAALKLANDTNRRILPKPKETDAEQFGRFLKIAEQGDLEHLKSAGDPTQIPVFVLGMLRSGTSLVEQIIASHSAAYGAGELMAATNLSQDLYRLGKQATVETMKAFTDGYLEQLSQHAGPAIRIVDKMPGNFFYVGLLKLAFPNAKIIATVRDPRDNCFSIYKNIFATAAHQYAYNERELAWFANEYKRMMDMWDRMFPDQIHHVRYEALVGDQEGESRKLVDFLDLPWEDGVLEFHKTKRAVRTASLNQVRQKIYANSVKSWQNYETCLPDLFEGLDRALWADALVD